MTESETKLMGTKEKTFTFYLFDGIYYSKCNGEQRLKKMSLKKCFDKGFNTYYDDNTEKLFKRNDFKFETKEKTKSQIETLIGEGFVFFPVSKLQGITEVKNYMDMGFIPMFMKVTEYRKLKKALLED